MKRMVFFCFVFCFFSFVVPVIFTVTRNHVRMFIRRVAVRLSGGSIKGRTWGHVDMFNTQYICVWNFKLRNWKWGWGGGSVGKMIAGQAWWSEFRSTMITEKPGVIEYTCKYNARQWRREDSPNPAMCHAYCSLCSTSLLLVGIDSYPHHHTHTHYGSHHHAIQGNTHWFPCSLVLFVLLLLLHICLNISLISCAQGLLPSC